MEENKEKDSLGQQKGTEPNFLGKSFYFLLHYMYIILLRCSSCNSVVFML